jgi:signal transduction histidine kinase
LAAGIAHEINTPIQYVQNNVTFFEQAFNDLKTLLVEVGKTERSLLTAETAALLANIDLDFLLQEIPEGIKETHDGISRVVKIVSAMKAFSHPSGNDKVASDLNSALDSTIAVCRNEWKYVAEMITDFDPDLPLVPCFPDQLNQVVLNLIINASHAIQEHNKLEAGRPLGRITIATRKDDAWIEIQVSDSGGGIPEAIQQRVFDPFFTTKGVGKGTGQGLAIAHDIVVNKHGGRIEFTSKQGQGTTFFIRLPVLFA